MESEFKVKSLAKALKILECFTPDRMELGITEIGDILGLNKSNVHNIVSTFCKLGYLRSCENGKYSLGLALVEYAFIVNKQLGFQNAIYDITFDLSNRMDEIVHFGIPYKNNVMYLQVIHPISSLPIMSYRNTTGLTAPLYSTAIGKAILASFPEEDWMQYIPENREKYTINSLVNYKDIIDELKKTKQRGFSIDNEEKDPGVKCIGIPIFNIKDKLIGGLSVSGHKTTMTEQKMALCVEELFKAQALIRERLYQ